MDRYQRNQSHTHQNGAQRDNGAQRGFSLQPWEILLGGGALALLGMTRRSKAGIALAAAGGLVALSSTRFQKTSMSTAEASFTINCSPEEAYNFWRNFENLPHFMHHLESVRVEGNRSEWVAAGPMDSKIRWLAEITEDRRHERIAWHSLPGSDIDNSGWVEFRPATAGRGIIVKVKMHYRPPMGALGRTAALVFGKDPEFAVREDLRRFKALIETGEIPTTVGQTHGPRGVHGQASRVLFREEPDQPTPQLHQPVGRTA
jgi:uncharacterized membrane protein